MVIRIDITSPCDPTTDARVFRSGPTAVPTPAREWQGSPGIPVGDSVNSSRPRCTWAGRGFWADTTCRVVTRTSERYKARRIISPFSGLTNDSGKTIRSLRPGSLPGPVVGRYEHDSSLLSL